MAAEKAKFERKRGMEEILEEVKKAEPFVRSVLAFLIYVRWDLEAPACYDIADEFLGRLKKDVEGVK